MPVSGSLVRPARACLLGLALMLAAAAPASADRAFTARFSTNDTGDIVFASAPLMTCSSAAGATNAAACPGAQTATVGPAGTGQIASQNDNNYDMVPVDRDGDPATTQNSSTSQLVLPSGATVLFAGLYWGGDLSGTTNGIPNTSAKFRVPGGSYQTLTATTTDTGLGGNAARYQSFRDVTALVAGAGAGTYAVGDVGLGIGSDHYGGWTLVVAYRDTAQPARNLTVFDGLTTVVSNAPPITIPVSGFQTPPAGPVRTSLGFITYEGDLGLGGDTASLNATTLGDAANPSSNFFNSSISRNGARTTTRDPNYPNTLGYDADVLNANGILANGATNATIRVTTSADQYLPGVITFATELFAPDIGMSKSVQNLTHPGGPDQPGDVLRYTVTASNTGQDGADAFTLRDAVPANSTYVAGSLRVTAGPGAPASPSDAADGDNAEFDAVNDRVVYRLGTGASATAGGRLAAGASTSVSFDTRIGQVPPRTQIVNQASSSFVAQTLRVPLTSNSNPTTTTVAGPDLAITKVHSPAFVSGSQSTFRLIVSNVGNLATDGSTVTVTDSFPAAAFGQIRNAGGSGWSCSTAGLSLTCTRADVLAAGDAFPPILVDADVLDPAPASIQNTATVAGGGDVDPTNNTGTDVGGSASAADLSLTKVADPPTVASGGTVTYTLEVHNSGPSTAQAVVVDDPIGSGLGSVSATSTRGTCTTAVSCAIGALAPGESATITVSATVTANNTTIDNTATTSSSTPDPTPADNTASAHVAVPNTADLRMVKTSSPANPVAGAVGGLTYTLTTTNLGPGTATGIEIADDLPASFTPTAINAPGGTTCNNPGAGGTLRCTAASLANGSAITVTVQGTVTASAQATFLSNNARVTSASTDPNPANDSSSTTNLATPAADLSISKEWGTLTDPFSALNDTPSGTDVRIRLTITNNGPNTATNAVISDTLPSGVAYVSNDQAADCSAAGQAFSCAVPSLASGAQFVVLVRVTVTASGSGSLITNHASVHADQPDPIDSNDTAQDTIGVSQVADVALSKTVSSATATVGQNVTFTLRATNNGPSTAAAVTVTDALPAGLSFVSGSGCTAAAGTVTCALGAISSGSSASATFVAAPTSAAAGTTITNTATASSTTPDPDPANNDGGASVTVAPQSDLRFSKVASTGSPRVDEDVTFTLQVVNDGPNDATGVAITDPVPTAMRFVAAPGCAYVDATRIVTCPVGALANGATTRRTVTLRPGPDLAGQALTNAASVAGAQTDPDPSNNDGRADVSVQRSADLRISKVANAASVTAGGPVTYTLAIANAGPSDATNTHVEDPLPAGVTPRSAAPSQGTCAISASAVSCDLGMVAAGGAAQIVIVADTPASGSDSIDNTATVHADEDDPRPQDDSATASVGLTPPPPNPPAAAQLSVRKTVSQTAAHVGETLDYLVEVRNTGTVTAHDVVMTDTIDHTVSLLDVAPSTGACAGNPVLRCRLGDLGPGAVATIRVRVRVIAAGKLTNTASAVTADAGATAPSDNAQTVVTRPRTRLHIHKVAARRTVASGKTIGYAVRVANVGNTAAVGVKVCDRVPRLLSFASAPGARFSHGQACWSLGTIAPGHFRVVRIVLRAANAARSHRILNTARVTAVNAAALSATAPVTLRVAPARSGGVTG